MANWLDILNEMKGLLLVEDELNNMGELLYKAQDQLVAEGERIIWLNDTFADMRLSRAMNILGYSDNENTIWRPLDAPQARAVLELATLSLPLLDQILFRIGRA